MPPFAHGYSFTRGRRITEPLDQVIWTKADEESFAPEQFCRMFVPAAEGTEHCVALRCVALRAFTADRISKTPQQMHMYTLCLVAKIFNFMNN